MSFDYTGSFSGSFTGEIVAVNGVLSSSAQVAANLPAGVVSSSTQVSYGGTGLISSSRQIEYSQVKNKPVTITSFQKNAIVANNRFREVTYPADSASVSTRLTILEQRESSASFSSRLTVLETAVDATGSDSQTLSFNDGTSVLSISDGNDVDLSTLAGGGGDGLALTASNEGSTLSKNVRTLDFVGNAVTATNVGSSVTVTINTGSVLPIPTSSITNFDTEVSRSVAAAGFGSGNGDTQVFSAGVDITINSGSGTVEISGSEFDGNRVVSNTNLPSGIYNVNFGTSGSLSNFIEKVFFPNSTPSITSHGFTIEEFEASGSSIGTATATDAEGQSITFRVASSYTDDFFKIASGGQITLNTQSTESMNTDNTPGSGSHPFPIEAVDTFNGVGSRTLYIRVNPNTAPKWRQTGVSGTVITTFTQSLNENSVAGNNKAQVFFTDDENDTITINTGSLPADFASKFSLDIESTYVQLNQTTSSLDYEDITQFNIVLTASDQHYQDGDDVDSVAYLPFQVAVEDNTGPQVQDQVVGTINENSANGATVGTVTATDNEGDTIVFSNFTLSQANLNGGADIKSTLDAGAGNLYNPARDPFQISSAGVVTRKNGVFLNSDVANRYLYTVTVTDAFNTTTDTGIITINISDDVQSTITDNWTNPYIIESAVDGDYVRVNSNGRTGTIAQWSSAVSQRWEVSSENDLIEVTTLTGSSTQLRVKNDVSGSLNSFDGDNRISVRLTASEHGFETTKQYIDVDVRVAINNAPNITFTNTSTNLNTNGARPSNNLVTIVLGDPEGDDINHGSFTFTDPSGQLTTVQSGNNYIVRPVNNLSGSKTYEITASVKDEHGFRTNTEEHTFTIAQAGTGTLTGDTNSFIISNAVSGANIQDATGEGNGNNSDLNVSYSPNYNSQAVQSFTSSNSAIVVDNNGGLTLARDISATTSQSGDTITSNITFRDQYDNVGSGTVTVTVFRPDAEIYGKVYVYDVGYNISSFATAVGRSSQDSSVPPIATPFSGGFISTVSTSSVIGDDSFTYTFGGAKTATLLASGSGTNVHNILRGMGSSGNITRSGNTHFLILMPSGSELSGVPTSVRDSYGGSALHEYVLEVGSDGTTVDGTNTIENSQINQIDLATDHFGFTTWFLVGATNQVTSTSTFNLGLSPSSGSGGV